MSSALNYLISSFYMLSAISIWFFMTSFVKNAKIHQLSVWFFWLLALIFHVYSLQPIFDSNYSIDLSINHALMIVAFIISISLYILSIIGNTQYLGIIILPIISIIFLF